MSPSTLHHDSSGPDAGTFQTTHWSLVVAAARRSSGEGAEALATLCRNYWQPLYCYARRRAADDHQAQDWTQAFFAQLLDKNYLAQATPERGRFRAFLITAFKHFLSKEWDKAKAKKRGGGKPAMPLDFKDADSRMALEPADHLTPEALYHREWALTLLQRVMERLEEECQQAGKPGRFAHLKGFLIGESHGTYAEAAAQLGMTEAAVKMATHRLRREYRAMLRAEIAQTVADPADIEDEIRSLFAAVAG